MDAVNGIGSADSLETDVVTLDIDNTTLGNIDITESNAVSLNQADQDSPGTVNITAGGDITIVSGQSGITSIAGTVTIDAGANTIHFDEDITTVAGDVSIQSDVEIGDDVTVNTGAGLAGDILFTSAIDEDFLLTLTAGTGNVQLDGAVGSTTPLSGFSVVSATNIDINNSLAADDQGISFTSSGTVNMAGAVTTTSNGTVTITNGGLLTLEDSCDMSLDGAFLQNGAGETVTGGGITTTNDNIFFMNMLYIADSTDNMTFNSGAGVFLCTVDIHVYVPGRTVLFFNDFSCRNFVLYSGNINLNGNDLTVFQDFVAFGAAYDDVIGTGVTDLYSYDNPARSDAAFPGNVLADDNAALITAIPLPVPIVFTEAAYAGSFSDLAGSTITVPNNYYVNGCNMTGTGNWTLSIPDNASALAGFAEAYNMSVSFSQAAAGWVAAGENVTDANPGSCANWDFTSHTLLNGTAGLAAAADWNNTTGDIAGVYPGVGSDDTGCLTVYDNVIRVEIGPAATAKLFENSNNEISRAVTAAAITADNGAVSFTGSFTDRDCTISTDGAGDIDVFYLKVADADTWNTDADGTTAGNGISTDMGRPVALPAAPIFLPTRQLFLILQLRKESGTILTVLMLRRKFICLLWIIIKQIKPLYCRNKIYRCYRPLPACCCNDRNRQGQ